MALDGERVFIIEKRHTDNFCCAAMALALTIWLLATVLAEPRLAGISSGIIWTTAAINSLLTRKASAHVTTGLITGINLIFFIDALVL